MAGNTPMRNACFTINNPGLDDEVYLKKWSAIPNVKYLVFQRERGENGTIHLQGYIELSKTMRFNALKSALDPTAHLERRRGTPQEASDYCQKEETRIAGPYTFGDPFWRKQGKRTDLQEAVELLKSDGLKAVREQYPATYVRYHRGLAALSNATLVSRDTPPRVHLLYGPPGCGKTRFFYDTFDANNRVSIACSRGPWFDGYDGEDAVLLDDFAGRMSKWPLVILLRVLDRYSIRVEIKGGFINWNPTDIVLTSNYHPKKWYDWDKHRPQWRALVRRFTRVTEFNDEGPMVIEPGTPEWETFWEEPVNGVWNSI